MRRWLAGAGAALLLAVQAFSAVYLAQEADHDCTGEGCPVCLDLQQCAAAFQQLGAGAPPASAPVVAAPVCAGAAPLGPCISLAPHTLVSLKVRFNE